MASIRDVAKAAGVSNATVSNVLNGRTDKVSSDTRKRVLAAVRLLKYRPTPLEQNQKAIQSKNLGFVIPDLAPGPFTRDGYFRVVLDGVMETAAFRGWSITIFVERMWDHAGHVVRRSYDGRCDGLVMVAPQPGNEVVRMLHERGTPMVLVGTTPWLSSVSSVDVDNASIGAAAARHLIELGHSRLVFIGEEREQVSSIERREAFFEEALRAGLGPDQLSYVVIPFRETDEPDAPIAADLLLEVPERPSGIFCWHDGLAVPFLAELKRLGHHIPREFSVISVNDSWDAETTEPPLTSFKNPVLDIGKRAAKMIIDRLTESGEATEHVRFPADLSVRHSTGPAPR